MLLEARNSLQEVSSSVKLLAEKNRVRKAADT